MNQQGIWEIKLPNALGEFLNPRAPYYFKLDQAQGQELCRIIAKTYGVSAPRVVANAKKVKEEGHVNGFYEPREATIYVYAKAHIKTYLHLFFYHLFFEKAVFMETEKISEHQIGWVWAELYWAAMRALQTETTN